MDALFGVIFFAFLSLRINGLFTGDLDTSELAFDTLSLAGCVLFPRLSISLLRGNIVLLALSVRFKIVSSQNTSLTRTWTGDGSGICLLREFMVPNARHPDRGVLTHGWVR